MIQTDMKTPPVSAVFSYQEKVSGVSVLTIR